MPSQPQQGGVRRLVVRRLPRTNVYSIVELVLLLLLAVQAARLVYTFVTPVGPIGAWQPPGAGRSAPLLSADLAAFDPFFRLVPASGAPAVVTSLSLQLFGVREDRATGRGSAIISTPDGVQRSYLVGEEIMPGVTLAAVGFDNVTISRGGAREQLFLDQSDPRGNNAPTVPAPSAITVSPPGRPAQLPVIVAPPPAPPPSPLQQQPAPAPPPVIRNGTGQ
jgi:general secretion pathway protein C